MAPQFFLPPRSLKDKTFVLDGPEAYHIAKVLRRREGEEIELFDGRGGRYKGRIARLHADGRVEGVLTQTLSEPGPGPDARLNLYPALLKAARWEWLLEKATELGAHSFQPIVTQRTVVLLREAERVRAKGDRWGRIVLAAAKQCGRREIPPVFAPMPLRDALVRARSEGLVLMGWEGLAGSPASGTLKEALAAARGGGKGPVTVSLFIGPEGGFASEEVELAQSHGAVLFGMGTCALRAETAALAAAGLVLYELGIL